MPIFPERAQEADEELVVVDAGVINHEKTSNYFIARLTNRSEELCAQNYQNFSSFTQTSTWIL